MYASLIGWCFPWIEVIEVMPKWAPLGAARFKELVEDHYYDGVKFFRVIKVSPL
jgi:cyclophilin family peptidyl-prolyl cis-trans isomerase